jgi:putative transposase
MNVVQAVPRQFSRLAKTQVGFANENNLLKMFYAGILKAYEGWSHPIQNWNLTLWQLKTLIFRRLITTPVYQS